MEAVRSESEYRAVARRYLAGEVGAEEMYLVVGDSTRHLGDGWWNQVALAVYDGWPEAEVQDLLRTLMAEPEAGLAPRSTAGGRR